jgi:hypothetical protein
MRDVIVVLPGITDSVLSGPSGELWNLSGQALWSFAKTRRDSLRRLAVPEHDPRNPPPATDITATRLIEGFHGVFGLAKIDGYRPLFESLKDGFDVTAGGWTDDRPANLLTFAYDWRLSNRASANRLAEGITRKLDAWRRHTGDQEAKFLLIVEGTARGEVVGQDVRLDPPHCHAITVTGHARSSHRCRPRRKRAVARDAPTADPLPGDRKLTRTSRCERAVRYGASTSWATSWCVPQAWAACSPMRQRGRVLSWPGRDGTSSIVILVV